MFDAPDEYESITAADVKGRTTILRGQPDTRQAVPVMSTRDQQPRRREVLNEPPEMVRAGAWSCVSSLALADSNPGVKLPAFERGPGQRRNCRAAGKYDTPLVCRSRRAAADRGPGRKGTAALFADLIQKVPVRNTAQLAEAIDSVGGEIGTGASTKAQRRGASFMARIST
jgi:hypothetical protein